MFTGIVREVGKVGHVEGDADLIKLGIKIGSREGIRVDDSIAINGVCLTVVGIEGDEIYFDVLPETMRLTNLGRLEIEEIVNIERSLTLADRIDGHMVQGHVDGRAEVIEISDDGEARLISLKGEIELIGYIVKKAYISLDGVSLTVVEVIGDIVKVMIIPHTYSHTNIRHWQKGSLVNVEIDIINKSIYRYMNLMKDNI